MPRDGANIYTIPPGTDGVSNTTIASTKYNSFIHDVESDLNLARPIVAGGTGATSAAGARTNLKVEVSMQTVTNFDTQVWEAGSFTAAAGATSAPTANAQAGVALVIDSNNIILRSVDTTTKVIYMRSKTAGVWGSWGAPNDGSVRYDTAQSLTDPQMQQALANIAAAPIEALEASGIQLNGSLDYGQDPPGMSATPSGLNPVDGGYRILASNGGQTFSGGWATIAGPSDGFTKAIQLQATSSLAVQAGANVQFYYPIEAQRMARLRWGTANARPLTVIAYLLSTVSGQASVAVRNPTNTRAYCAPVTLAAGWNFVSVTVPGETTGTWGVDNAMGMAISFTIGAGSSLIAPAANAWQSGANYIAAPGQTYVLATNTNIVAMTGMLLLPGLVGPTTGNVARAMRSSDRDIQACLRYYERRDFAQNQVISIGVVQGAGISYGALTYLAPKRISIATLAWTGAMQINVNGTPTNVDGAISMTSDNVMQAEMNVSASGLASGAGTGCRIQGGVGGGTLTIIARM